MNLAQKALVGALRLYQLTLSPLLAVFFGPSGRCRFSPSCSHYAVDAVRLHGAWRGSFLAARRLGRCHPWGEGGEDYPPTPGALKEAGHFHGS